MSLLLMKFPRHQQIWGTPISNRPYQVTGNQGEALLIILMASLSQQHLRVLEESCLKLIPAEHYEHQEVK
jgi:hypothetical protein